jgi:hypothetical protein
MHINKARLADRFFSITIQHINGSVVTKVKKKKATLYVAYKFGIWLNVCVVQTIGLSKFYLNPLKHYGYYMYHILQQ